MTVFGFSRQGSSGGDFSSRDVPLTFSFGLLEDDSYTTIKPFVNGVIANEPIAAKALSPVQLKSRVQPTSAGSAITLMGRQATALQRGVSLVRQQNGVVTTQLHLPAATMNKGQNK
jgi:hypothetical protein